MKSAVKPIKYSKNMWVILFIEFLLWQGVLTQFAINLAREKKKPLLKWVTDFLTQDVDYLVTHAFTWYSTTEGFKFWNDLEDKWLEQVKHLNKLNLDNMKIKGRIHDIQYDHASDQYRNVERLHLEA